MIDLSCKKLCWFGMMCLLPLMGLSQQEAISNYNPVWHSQSKNSGESMPCGGGDIGLNVWVENGELLFYFSRSGTFDENNAFLKLGRMRVKLSPNPFAGKTFRQELDLQEGSIKIHGADKDLSADIEVWVDVFRPVIHVEVNSSQPLQLTAAYESWRHEDRVMRGKENNANSYKWAPVEVITFHDSIAFQQDQVLFYHQNRDEPSIFDVTVHQQKMDSVKSQMFNPLKNLIFGGVMQGKDMRAAGTYTGKYIDTSFKGWKLQSKTASPRHQVDIFLHTDQTAITDWQSALQTLIEEVGTDTQHTRQKTKDWWKAYWDRSYIYLLPELPDTTLAIWQVGRNYQLFRYMLGCNAYGAYPTKFNGGLFTYDPSLVDSTLRYTPDFRNWGGGTMTAQNQRLVYFPMLKSGDFDMMPAQFNFYLQSQHNAELRSKVYWGHGGACFTEQLENFGLPNCSEYGWERPKSYDPGMQYNAWLEYQWDTVLEFCLMMLETERYTGQDITAYIPFIESCLTFFDEHYQYLATQRGAKTLDEQGKLVLYPGSACETYKMAYNATSTIAGLQTVINRLLALPKRYLTTEKRAQWQAMSERIPPISYRQCEGYTTIAPAQAWARINNVETPQLYPIYPWGLYGVGKSDLEIALNTWKYDPEVLAFKSAVGWKQYNIFAARLGLTEEAARLTVEKMKDSGRRFPAFWGPGFDWTPDHNWGGSGMIGLQEMLLQTDGKKIHLLPAWPKEWDVHFKLHAPYSTTIEGKVKDGKLILLEVQPASRKKDILLAAAFQM